MSWLQAVVDSPDDVHEATGKFWSRALGWPLGPPWPGHPELRTFTPRQGDGYVHLQQVDASPRVHLDLELPDRWEAGRRAVALGATPRGGSADWDTYRSPGGLPFCVLQARPHSAPAPTTWPDAHRSRLVQVCVDAPAERHDDEVVFWRRLLGGRWVDSPSPEFAGKWHDDAGSPLQLLFQRLDEPDGDVRAHLDLGTDDQGAEVRRLLGELGARDVGPGPGGWHVLRDPAGREFCVTENPPGNSTHRDLG